MEKLLGSMDHIYVTVCNAYETIYWKRLQYKCFAGKNIKVKLNRIEGYDITIYTCKSCLSSHRDSTFQTFSDKKCNESQALILGLSSRNSFSTGLRFV
jgi:hypothetical protein